MEDQSYRGIFIIVTLEKKMVSWWEYYTYGECKF